MLKRADSLPNLQCIGVKLLSNELNIARKTIIVGSQDTGSGEALAPVVKVLGERYNLVVYAGARAADVLEKPHYGLLPLPKISTSLNFSLILGGISQSGPGIERRLTRWAKAQKIPTVWISDSFSGTQAKHLYKPHGADVYPDYFCLPYQGSKGFLVKTAPYFDESKVLVTGNPAFDELFVLAQKRDEIRGKIRGDIGLDDSVKLLVFASQAEQCDIDNLNDVVDGLLGIPNEMRKKIVLGVRFHPADRKKIEQFKPAMERLTEVGRGRIVDTYSVTGINELMLAADAVASMFSTVNLKSLYFRGVPYYLLHLKEAREILYRDQRITPDQLPMVESGAGVLISDRSQFQPAFEMLFDGLFQHNIREAQKKYYPLDGKNTERVVHLIDSILT